MVEKSVSASQSDNKMGGERERQAHYKSASGDAPYMRDWIISIYIPQVATAQSNGSPRGVYIVKNMNHMHQV